MPLKQTLIKIIRDPFLFIEVLPVLLATSMAFGDGIWHWPSALAALFAVFLAHIAVNLIKETNKLKTVPRYLDDDQASAMPPAKSDSSKSIIVFLCACVFLIALYLMSRGGWAIAIIGILVAFSAIFYLMGKHPLVDYGCFPIK